MNQSRPILSICIPTYERADILAEGLELIIAEVRPYNLPIYISDDGSKDRTHDVVKKAQKTYAHIHFRSGNTNVGYDRNFSTLLRWADSDFLWLMGDYSRMKSGGVAHVLKILEASGQYDIVVVNGLNRVKTIESKEYGNSSDLLQELAWHMTWVSCLIFSRDLAQKSNYERYFGTDFAHVGAIFENLAKRPFRAIWESTNLVEDSAIERKNHYSKTPRIFVILIKNWTELILSLPASYSFHVKLAAIRNHERNCRTFTFKEILYRRSLGHYNLQTFRDLGAHLHLCTGVSLLTLKIIAFLPQGLVSLLWGFKKALKNASKKILRG